MLSQDRDHKDQITMSNSRDKESTRDYTFYTKPVRYSEKKPLLGRILWLKCVYWTLSLSPLIFCI